MLASESAAEPVGRPVVEPTAENGCAATGPVRRAAVLGHPVAHSLSPVLHRAAYAATGLPGWSYGLHDCTQDALPAFLGGLDPAWAGLSLTMPLKKAVIPLLEQVSPLARAVGAVNTVTFPGGDAPAGGVGDNTDVHGLVAALREAGVGAVRRGVVLGGGATASSAVAALLELGCAEPTLRLRSVARAGETLAAAERLGARPRNEGFDDALGAAPLDGVDVVVSTVPIGASAALAGQLAGAPAASDPLPRTGAGPALPVLLDVVYAPWPTPLATAWAARGGTVVSGFAMLLHQAGEQFRLMTGLAAPLAAMRTAGEAELARRAATPSG